MKMDFAGRRVACNSLSEAARQVMHAVAEQTILELLSEPLGPRRKTVDFGGHLRA
jgi:hypothetical protein